MSEQSSLEPRRPLPGDELIGPGDGSMCKSGDLALQDKLRSVQDRNESLERQLRERTIELQEANDRLQGEIAERGWIEAALGEIRLELELVVQERTADLHTATESLRQEIAERRRVEEAFRESEAMLREPSITRRSSSGSAIGTDSRSCRTPPAAGTGATRSASLLKTWSFPTRPWLSGKPIIAVLMRAKSSAMKWNMNAAARSGCST